MPQEEYEEAVNMINDEIKEKCLEKYKDLFNGLGKIKDFKYKIELKKDSIEKIEPCRHVPFKLIINKLKVELDKIEEMGVISKIEKPTDFVSSLVIVGKVEQFESA